MTFRTCRKNLLPSVVVNQVWITHSKRKVCRLLDFDIKTNSPSEHHHTGTNHTHSLSNTHRQEQKSQTDTKKFVVISCRFTHTRTGRREKCENSQTGIFTESFPDLICSPMDRRRDELINPKTLQYSRIILLSSLFCFHYTRHCNSVD